MTDEGFMLGLLVVVMLLGSYIAGSIPLVMHLSEETLKFVTVLGAGLLVGTALTVIIPEGIRSLYTTPSTHSDHENNMDVASSSVPEHVRCKDDDYSGAIALSLLLGFIFMMLVDQVSQRKRSSNQQDITATLGLVVHAAADGVALGAAGSSGHQDVEMIVFLAIMLHKAPAAFGLVSFLLHEKNERKQIRKHLLIFSLSAPLFTIITYFGLGQEHKETLNMVNATGIAMLFSAGTFLYVATVHILPELIQGGHHEYRALEDCSVSNAHHSGGKKGLRYSELIALVVGAFLPLILTIGHHH